MVSKLWESSMLFLNMADVYRMLVACGINFGA